MNQVDIVQLNGAQGGVGQTLSKLQYLNSPNADNDPERIRSAARELSSYFLHMLIREMRKSIPKNPVLYGGKTEEIFQDFLDEEFAAKMARSGQLGLADSIYESLENLLKPNRQSADIEGRGSA